VEIGGDPDSGALIAENCPGKLLDWSWDETDWSREEILCSGERTLDDPVSECQSFVSERESTANQFDEPLAQCQS